MKSARIPTPYGFTIFCDDIRQEASGKFLFIGVYRGSLIVKGAFPALLPTFAVAVSYLERPGESADPVSVSVYLPGEETPVAATSLPVDEFRKQTVPEEDAKELDGDPIPTMNFNFVFSPLLLTRPGRISVRLTRGDSVYRIGSLKIEAAPNAVAQASQAERP